MKYTILVSVLLLGVAQLGEHPVDNREVKGSNPFSKTTAELSFFLHPCGSLFVGYPSHEKVYRVCLFDREYNSLGCFIPSDPVVEVVQVDPFAFGFLEATVERDGRPAVYSLGIIPARTDGIALYTVNPYACSDVTHVHEHNGQEVHIRGTSRRRPDRY